ncbi:MAG TPA: hypothetical protein EYH42_10090 [Sulfurovum sp.]|nr:hypothetical protein [Sulfurovum sp.]
MIVFNKNIIFCNESELNIQIPLDSALETINIIEKQTCTEIFDVSIKSIFMEMSGQEVRYLSEQSFSKADKTFSWGIEIKDILTLVWDAKEREIHYIKGENYTPERLRFWIYHTFLPLVLELEKTYHILHVGAVEVDEKPILFSAFSFGGKSTMTDYFLKQGHTLLSDDSLGIDKREDGYYAISSYPYHRPYRELETLGYYTENFSTTPKSVYVMYVLDKSKPDSSIEIVELKGIEKFKAFHYSTFINFDFMKKERFEYFAEMAKHVPVYKISVPWDKERLAEVYDAIIQKIQEL